MLDVAQFSIKGEAEAKPHAQPHAQPQPRAHVYNIPRIVCHATEKNKYNKTKNPSIQVYVQRLRDPHVLLQTTPASVYFSPFPLPKRILLARKEEGKEKKEEKKKVPLSSSPTAYELSATLGVAAAAFVCMANCHDGMAAFGCPAAAPPAKVEARLSPPKPIGPLARMALTPSSPPFSLAAVVAERALEKAFGPEPAPGWAIEARIRRRVSALSGCVMLDGGGGVLGADDEGTAGGL